MSRVYGCFDPFETAISIILSQLVSTEHAKSKLKTLVQRFGRKIRSNNSEEVFEFPSASILATAKIEEIGVTKSKACAIRELSQAIQSGAINFKSHTEFSTVSAQFTAIKGVGPWTATMIAMRCLGDPDAFPEYDLIIQRALEKKLVNQANWISSRAYLTHCLWRDFGDVLSKTKRRRKK